MGGPKADRRGVIAGLGAGAVFGWPAAAQTSQPDVRLVANLFTRVGGSVRLGDHGPYTFVIDTGAGATAVADTLAGALPLEARDPMRVHGLTAAEVTPSVRVDRLSLGGLRFRDLRCPVLPRDRLGADGLIGLDVLSRFRLDFDTRRRSVMLTGRGLSVAMDSFPTLGRRYGLDALETARGRFGQLLLTEIALDGQPAVAFIDSGAQYSIGNLALRDAVRTRRPDTRRPLRPVTLRGVTGDSVAAELLVIQDFRLGHHRLGSTPALFADLHCFHALGLGDRPTVLIGADLLARFRQIAVDFPANAISLRGLQRPTPNGLEALTA